MLEDKLRETDWEVTQETIEEQVARESYMQWLRDQEKAGGQSSVKIPCMSFSTSSLCLWFFFFSLPVRHAVLQVRLSRINGGRKPALGLRLCPLEVNPPLLSANHRIVVIQPQRSLLLLNSHCLVSFAWWSHTWFIGVFRSVFTFAFPTPFLFFRA
jgi:hypothetical protein